MTAPHLLQRGCRNEVLPRILLAEQGNESFKTLHCSTWNIECSLSRFLVHQAALRRAWTRIAAKAAGVIPRSRPAAPRVGGRAMDRRSTISFERPAIPE